MNPKDFLIEAVDEIYHDDYTGADSSMEMLVIAIAAAAFVFAALVIIFI